MRMIRAALVALSLAFLAAVVANHAHAQQAQQVQDSKVACRPLYTMNPLTEKWTAQEGLIPQGAQVFVLDVNMDPVPAVVFGVTDKNQVLLVPLTEFDQYERKWEEEHKPGADEDPGGK